MGTIAIGLVSRSLPLTRHRVQREQQRRVFSWVSLLLGRQTSSSLMTAATHVGITLGVAVFKLIICLGSAVAGQSTTFIPHKGVLSPSEKVLYLSYSDGAGPYDGELGECFSGRTDRSINWFTCSQALSTSMISRQASGRTSPPSAVVTSTSVSEASQSIFKSLVPSWSPPLTRGGQMGRSSGAPIADRPGPRSGNKH